MKLREQVVTLEIAKKLYDLGVKQESLFIWEYYNDKCYDVKFIPYVVCKPLIDLHQYSAFTASELMDKLPSCLILTEYEPLSDFRLNILKCSGEIKYIIEYVGQSIPGEEVNNPFFKINSNVRKYSSNLASGLGNLLIHLIENKLVIINKDSYEIQIGKEDH